MRLRVGLAGSTPHDATVASRGSQLTGLSLNISSMGRSLSLVVVAESRRCATQLGRCSLLLPRISLPALTGPDPAASIRWVWISCGGRDTRRWAIIASDRCTNACFPLRGDPAAARPLLWATWSEGLQFYRGPHAAPGQLLEVWRRGLGMVGLGID